MHAVARRTKQSVYHYQYRSTLVCNRSSLSNGSRFKADNNGSISSGILRLDLEQRKRSCPTTIHPRCRPHYSYWPRLLDLPLRHIWANQPRLRLRPRPRPRKSSRVPRNSYSGHTTFNIPLPLLSDARSGRHPSTITAASSTKVYYL